MNKIKKMCGLMLAFMLISLANPIGASAAWKQDNGGWWYTEGNSWAVGWRQIEGKWYYFYADGYMAKNTVLNGYKFGADGAWISSKAKTNTISVTIPSHWVKYNPNSSRVDVCYLLDNKGTNVNLVKESMQGLSEEAYNKASDLDVKTNLYVNEIKAEERQFNNIKARVTYYVQKYNDIDVPTYQVTFLNNNTSYIFTLCGREKISDENLKSFNEMLNTVNFYN